MRRTSKTKAVDLFDGGQRDDYNAYFYSTFGQAPRQSVCACETSDDAKLSQALHLINGDTIERALSRESVLIPALMKTFPNQPRPVIEQLYIRALTRKPSESEWEALLSEWPDTMDVKQQLTFYNNVMWSLLNSSEFLFNH